MSAGPGADQVGSGFLADMRKVRAASTIAASITCNLAGHTVPNITGQKIDRYE
jgi:hypothetical protein